MMNIGDTRKLCSVCGERKRIKGSRMRFGRFVCAECAASMSIPRSAVKKPENQYAAVKARREERKNEAAQLATAREERERREQERAVFALEQMDARFDAAYEKMLASLHGKKFGAWYEATTGEPVAAFIDRFMAPKGFYVGEVGSGWRRRMCERFRAWARSVSSRHYWQDPETRKLLTAELASATDPKARRNILMGLATPRWASRREMVKVYLERDRIVRETGIPHDVDHIVPIVSRIVCGLHCEHNLRVITAFQNRSKSNKYCVDIDRVI